MEAIILAGGLGTRLRHVISQLPKPMAPVGNRPFLAIVLTRLAQKRFQRVVLSVGYLADTIIRHFGCNFMGMKLEYAIEEAPLGTGGGIRLALSHCDEDHVFVFNGDTYLDLEIDRVEAHWRTCRKPIIIARRVVDTQRYGRLEVHDGRLLGFAEKEVAGAGLINAGCYVLNPGILDAFPLGARFSFESDFLAKAISAGTFDCFVTDGYFIDIGVPEDYARAQTELSPLMSP